MIDSIDQLSSLSVAIEKFRVYVTTKYVEGSYVLLEYQDIALDFEQYSAHSQDPHGVLEAYYQLNVGVPAYKKPPRKSKERIARAIQMIRDFLEGREPPRRYCYKDSEPCKTVYLQVINSYKTSMTAVGLSEGTIRTRIGRIIVFFNFLVSKSCMNLGAITPQLLLEFISGLTDQYSTQGKASILYTLRNFFSYDQFIKQMAFDPMNFLNRLHSRKHERLPSFYSTEEVQRVMNAVDRGSSWGKTIYLMMLLACVYGLRVSDIIRINLSAINWNAGTLTIEQWKTKRIVILPLVDVVLYALLDYMKNARPSTDYPQLFIKIRQPHEPYADYSRFSDKVTSCFEKAGVNTEGKHHGLHSLRHSLATELLSEEVPVNEIAGILGHSSIAATKNYIWSDVLHLKSAALEVPPYDHG